MNWTKDALRSKKGHEIPVERAELVRPESDSNDREITLRLVRLPSEQPSAPPVIFLAGGPGDSAIAWPTHGIFDDAITKVNRASDLIFVDQRGCGESDPDLSMAPPEEISPDAFLTRESFLEFEKERCRQNAERFRARDIDLGAYNPVASAQDIFALAEALGSDQVQLWAYSYGTHLAQAILKRDQATVARAVFCGFEGPNQTWKLPRQVQNQMERIAVCQPVVGDLLGVAQRVHERLDREPVTVEVPLSGSSHTVRVGSYFVKWLAAGWSGLSNRFNAVPALYASLDAGDPSVLQKAMKLVARGWSGTAAFYLKDLASGATEDRLKQIGREAPSTLLEDAVNFPFPAIREAWGQPDLGDGFRQPLRSSVDLLVATGSMDGFTPTENAAQALPHLPNARHLVIRNAAHNDLLKCPAANSAIAAFFQDGRAPSEVDFAISEPSFNPYPES